MAGINDAALDFEKTSLAANPHPASIILSHLFHALRPKFGVRKAVAFILQPASAFDDPGIQELASQSVALLNGAKPKKKVFKDQVAFNILSPTPTDANGFCPDERRVPAEIRRVLGPPLFPLFLSIVQAPVFHTYAMMVYLELDRETDIAAIESLFKRTSALPPDSPSAKPARPRPSRFRARTKSSSAGSKKKTTIPRAFWIWLVADNLTRGSAVNAFDIAKIMLPIDSGREVGVERRPKDWAAAPPEGQPRGSAHRRRTK